MTGKVYGKILVEQMREKMEELAGEEWCAYKEGKGCVDRIFLLRSKMEKYCIWRDVSLCCLMALERAYPRMDKQVLWTVLRVK